MFQGFSESDVVIRPFIEADRKILMQIYLESRRETFKWLDTSSMSLTDFDRDTAGEAIWVATQDDNLVGFVSVYQAENFIHNLFILTKWLSQGVGSQLLKTALANVGRPARLKCLVQNTRAISFYRAKGWKKVGEGSSEDGEYHLLQLITEKPASEKGKQKQGV